MARTPYSGLADGRFSTRSKNQPDTQLNASSDYPVGRTRQEPEDGRKTSDAEVTELNRRLDAMESKLNSVTEERDAAVSERTASLGHFVTSPAFKRPTLPLKGGMVDGLTLHTKLDVFGKPTPDSPSITFDRFRSKTRLNPRWFLGDVKDPQLSSGMIDELNDTYRQGLFADKSVRQKFSRTVGRTNRPFFLHEGREQYGEKASSLQKDLGFDANKPITTPPKTPGGSAVAHIIPMRLDDYQALAPELPEADRFDPKATTKGGIRAGGKEAGTWEMDTSKPWGRATSPPYLSYAETSDGKMVVTGHDARHRVEEFLKKGLRRDTIIPVQVSKAPPIHRGTSVGAPQPLTLKQMQADLARGLSPEINFPVRGKRPPDTPVQRALRSQWEYDIPNPTQDTTSKYPSSRPILETTPLRRTRPIFPMDTPVQRALRSVTGWTGSQLERQVLPAGASSKTNSIFNIVLGAQQGKASTPTVTSLRDFAEKTTVSKLPYERKNLQREFLDLIRTAPKEELNELEQLGKEAQKNLKFSRTQQAKEILTSAKNITWAKAGSGLKRGALSALRVGKKFVGPWDIAIEGAIYTYGQRPDVKRKRMLAQDARLQQQRQERNDKRAFLMRHGSTKERALLMEYTNSTSLNQGQMISPDALKKQTKRWEKKFGGESFDQWLSSRVSAHHRAAQDALLTPEERRRRKRQSKLERESNVRGITRF